MSDHVLSKPTSKETRTAALGLAAIVLPLTLAIAVMATSNHPTHTGDTINGKTVDWWYLVGGALLILLICLGRAGLLRPAAGLVRVYLFPICMMAAGSGILYGVYCWAQHQSQREAAQMKAVVLAQNTLTSDTRPDWRRWHLDGVSAEANPGSIELVTAGLVRWVTDDRAPGAEYTSRFELAKNHAVFGLFDRPSLMTLHNDTYSEDGTFGQPSAKAAWGTTTEDLLIFSGVAKTAVFDYKTDTVATMLPVNIYWADGAADEVWAVGENCTAYRLEHGQKTWDDVSPNPRLGVPLERVAAFGGGSAVASGPTGAMAVWRNGHSYTTAGPSTNSLTDLWGANLGDVYAAADGHIYHSTDGCKSWKVVADPNNRAGQFRLHDRRIQRRAPKQQYVPEGSATRTFTASTGVQWLDTTEYPAQVAALYSVDGGAHWEQTTQALPRSDRLTVKIKLTSSNDHGTPILQRFHLEQRP